MKTLTSRLYQGQDDLQQMYNLLMEARWMTNDWRYAHIGELAFSFFMVDCHLNPHEHVRLWYEHSRLVVMRFLGKTLPLIIRV